MADATELPPVLGMWQNRIEGLDLWNFCSVVEAFRRMVGSGLAQEWAEHSMQTPTHFRLLLISW